MITARTVLIVMPEAFHLGWMGSSRFIFYLANALRELNYEVALLAEKHTNSAVQTEIDHLFPGKVIRTHHTGYYPRMLDVAALPRRAWRALWKIRGPEYYLSCLSWGWSNRLDLNWLRRELTSNNIFPEMVWSISGGYLGGAAAADRIGKAFFLPVIHELHDPPYGAGLGMDRTKVEKKFKQLLDNSKAIVVNSDRYRLSLLKRFSLSEEKVHTVHLTYAEPEPQFSTKPDTDSSFRIVYAGSMGGGRTLEPIIRGLALAFEINTNMQSDVKFELAGKGAGFDQALYCSEILSLSECVHYFGLLGGNDVCALLERANVLVALQTPQSAIHEIPGKLFESLAMKRPILGIMPTDCEGADILLRSGLGKIHDEDDIKGIAHSLIQLWKSWKENSSGVTPDNDYIAQFSNTRLSCKLKNVIQQDNILINSEN